MDRWLGGRARCSHSINNLRSRRSPRSTTYSPNHNPRHRHRRRPRLPHKRRPRHRILCTSSCQLSPRQRNRPLPHIPTARQEDENPKHCRRSAEGWTSCGSRGSRWFERRREGSYRCSPRVRRCSVRDGGASRLLMPVNLEADRQDRKVAQVTNMQTSAWQ